MKGTAGEKGERRDSTHRTFLVRRLRPDRGLNARRLQVIDVVLGREGGGGGLAEVVRVAVANGVVEEGALEGR